MRRLPDEFVYQIFSLVIAIILVHSVYVTLVRPGANAVLEAQAIRVAEDASYIPERSWFVVVRDFEQETCFVLMLWGVAILAYKALAIHRERRLLDEELMPLSEGMKILPEDARQFARQIQALPQNVRRALPPRCLLVALHRFTATENVNDASNLVQTVCQNEGERLESELSMIRYIVWRFPPSDSSERCAGSATPSGSPTRRSRATSPA